MGRLPNGSVGGQNALTYSSGSLSVRVFLVEDMLTVRSTVPDMLCRFGGLQLVGRAKGHAESRAWLEGHAGAWDLAVIDLVLDGWWCSDLIGCARNSHPGGRLVVFGSVATPAAPACPPPVLADANFPRMCVGDFASWLDAQRCRGDAATIRVLQPRSTA